MHDTRRSDNPVNVPEGMTCMVVHGPEAFDCGDVSRLSAQVRPGRIVVAGVMARTAAEESGIPCEYGDLPPSRVIREMEGRVFLVNRAKTDLSGRVFGEIVASRLADRGLVHVECTSRVIYLWNDGNRVLAEELSAKTGFPIVTAVSPVSPSVPFRTIRGCLRGEPVYVNGMVIGHATGEEVVLAMKEGNIVPVSGLEPKSHGLEKVTGDRCTDITRAWCKSGGIRASPPSHSLKVTNATGEVLLIDHCSHEIYRRLHPGICGIVSVGDDTTAVCGHITAHRGIPVFGIVDGDADHIVQPAFAPGSVIVEVLFGRDDDLGHEIAGQIDVSTVYWSSFVDKMIRLLEGRVRIVVDRRVEGT
jgi:hypothetical protein